MISSAVANSLSHPVSVETKYALSIDEWLSNPRYCGSVLKGNSYDNWKTLIKGFYNEVESLDTVAFSTMTERVVDSEFNELWVVGGRRAGKSHLASAIAVYEAFLGNHQAKLSKGEVATISLLASDRKQARTLMRYIKGIIDSIPPLKQLIRKQSSDIIELTNGCAIEIQTASYRGVRGYTLACAILDEVAFWYDDGANPDKEILKAIKPSLATLKGKLICLSSPYAKRGILWDAWRKYYSKHGATVLVAKCPTELMNPVIDKGILEQAEKEDSVSYRSEYLAEFRDDISSFVTEEALDSCFRVSALEIPYNRKYRYKAFIDASGGIGDAYTLAIGHQEPLSDVLIIDKVEVVHPPFSPEVTTEFISKIIKSYSCHQVTGDRYAGNWVRNSFERNGITYKVSEKAKTQLYQDLIPEINSGRIEFPPHEALKRELMNLERRTSRTGRIQIDHPPNAHDDIANACAGLASLFLSKVIAKVNFHFIN